MEFIARQTWRNHTGNQRVEPLRIYRPTALAELVEIVQTAEREGVTARAVGSRHSWSDAALTTGFVIETRGVCRMLEPDALRPAADRPPLVKAEAGMRLRELNDELARRGLALHNMGGYDEQTIGGVLSTATHGSGLEFGPICDSAVSLDVVGAGGKCYRIEPANGITDPSAFQSRYPNWRLVQDDAWFRAAKVGMGCLGILYAVVLEVRASYWLKEVRSLKPWHEVKSLLLMMAEPAAHRHWEVLINPHPTLGPTRDDHQCLITTRDLVAEPPPNTPRDRLHRNWLSELGGNLTLVSWLLRVLFEHFPKVTPMFLDLSLKGLKDDEGYTNVSYKVLNIGSPNHLPAISSEIGIPVDARGSHVEAVTRVLATAAKWKAEGRLYHSSPISLRFVRASDASLSMMHQQTTMMMELILFYPTEGGVELLAAYEDALADLGARPHWGQVNYLACGLPALYPEFAGWLAVYAELNRSGVFNSPFSKRVGIAASATRP
jgi:hypothetical protein